MGFVTEMVPEEDKNHPVFTEFRYGPWKDKLSPFEWLIDREKDMFFLRLPMGGPEQPHYYLFWWRGNYIYFQGYQDYAGTVETGYDYTWRDTLIRAPEILKDQGAEIARDLTAAIIKYGRWGGSNIHTRSVSIDISAQDITWE